MNKREDQRSAVIQLPYPSASGKKRTFWILSDIHFISPSLYRINEGAFSLLHQYNLGKLFEAMPEAMEEFEALALASRPDYVLVPGDILLNGEAASLRDMEPRFASLEDNGIRVCLIPGNHDIECSYTYSYRNDAPEETERVTAEMFEDRMGRFGFRQAVSKAPDSRSYRITADESLWILALDSNTGECPGTLSEPTLAWAKSELEEAERKKINVITMTHQNVLTQYPFMVKGFVLNNAEEVRDLLEAHHVALNLSGHCHLQHISRHGEFTDICTGAACVWPLGFAVLDVDEISGICVYSKREFSANQSRAIRRIEEIIEKKVSTLSLPETCGKEVKAEMIAFANDVIRLNFGGLMNHPEEYLQKPGWQFWKDYGTGHFAYEQLHYILTGNGTDSKTPSD